MKVTQEKLPASRIGLEIEVPAERSQQIYDKTLQKFARNANIPGFRKGKVPKKILLSQYGRQLRLAALEELVEDSIKQAIEQEKIDALGNIELISSFEDLASEFQPGSELTIAASVDVPPEATLTQYKGLTIRAEEVPYRSEQVDELLESYRDRLATRVPVEGRPAQANDLVLVDFQGIIAGETDADGNPKEVPGGSATDFEVELSEGRFIPGFIEGIIGMNVGETKEVTTTFPEEYPQDDVAGKDAVFTISLKEIKEKELPELDDDFAQEVSKFETLAELRESLEKRYREEAESKTATNKQQAFLDELLNHLEVELPESLVRREVDQMITQTAMRLSEQGMDIRQMFTAEVVESLRERTRPDAVTRLLRTMALGEIAKLESITVEQAEVDAKVQEVLEDVEDTSDINSDRLREVLEEDLLKEKIFSWLEENNTVELVPEGTLQPDALAEAADAAASEAAVPDTLDTPATEAEIEVAATAIASPATETAEAEPAATEPAATAPAEVETTEAAATTATSASPAAEPVAEPKKTKKSARSKTAKSASKTETDKTKADKTKTDKAETDPSATAPTEADSAAMSEQATGDAPTAEASESKSTTKAKSSSRKKTTRSKSKAADSSADSSADSPADSSASEEA